MSDHDRMNNQEYLRKDQYNNMDKLSARIRLHQDFSVNPMDIHRWFFDHMLAQLITDETLFILECGCGRGDLWQQNAEYIPDDWQITLTDFSPGMLADCQSFLGPQLAERFDFHQADIQSLPFSENSFDVVIANMMLYHVPDLDAALKSVRQVLRPRGVFFAMTNGDDHMAELLDLIDELDAEAVAWRRKSIQRSFSLQNGAQYLEKHFESVRLVRYEDSLHVTQVQPLVDYVASMISVPGEVLMSEQGQAFIERIQTHIQDKGAFDIRKDTGVFIAHNPRTDG